MLATLLISTKFKYLTSDICRLNISTADEATPSRSYRRTPVRGTSGKKRKRGEMAATDFGSFLQQRASAVYTQKSSAKGNLEVYETDTEGKYIKLFNNGDKVGCKEYCRVVTHEFLSYLMYSFWLLFVRPEKLPVVFIPQIYIAYISVF